MQELDLMTLVSVFYEMLGALLWVLLGLIVLSTAAFLGLLAKERGLVAKRLLTSQLWSVLGGVLALVIMAKVSSSGFTDAGGPADWFLIAAVFGIGTVGAMVVLYTLLGWGRRLSVRRT